MPATRFKIFVSSVQKEFQQFRYDLKVFLLGDAVLRRFVTVWSRQNSSRRSGQPAKGFAIFWLKGCQRSKRGKRDHVSLRKNVLRQCSCVR